MGLDFNRQKSIGNYIIDFYNSKYKLALEVIGSSHYKKYEYDLKRNDYLEKLGIHILYINDFDIKKNLPLVLEHIDSWITKRIEL